MKPISIREHIDFFDPEGLFRGNGSVANDEIAAIGEPLTIVKANEIARPPIEKDVLRRRRAAMLEALKQQGIQNMHAFIIAGIKNGRLQLVVDSRGGVRTRLNADLERKSRPHTMTLERMPDHAQKNVPRGLIRGGSY